MLGRVPVMAVATLAALVALSGCSSGPSVGEPPAPAAPADTPPGPTSIQDGMGAPEADGAFPRTVTHFGGVTTIPAPPQRVVVIATGQTDAILTLGVVPVGAASGDDADLVPHYVRGAFPQHATQLAAAHGREVECRALARAVRWHTENRVALNGTKTVVLQ